MNRDSAAIRILLVSRNIQTIETLCQHMQKVAMHVETACDVDSANRKLCHCKFEGVIIDLELGDVGLQLLKRLRGLTSHRHAVSFAIVGNEIEAGIEYQAHATFVLQRPFSAPAVIRTLRASYPMMFRERRRDYRYPIEMRLMITVGETESPASSINISETGIAVESSAALTIGTRVRLRLDLPGMAESLKMSGEVRWTDPTGRAGIHFLDVAGLLAQRLQVWLSERMTELLPRC
jgi:response regulator RpfG family c-di-GMP phosphodiesterase